VIKRAEKGWSWTWAVQQCGHRWRNGRESYAEALAAAGGHLASTGRTIPAAETTDGRLDGLQRASQGTSGPQSCWRASYA
jgi:hypothetical protein